MSECIAMAIGVLLGAGCVGATALATLKLNKKTEYIIEPEKDTKDQNVAGAVDTERIKKQFENFLNYNGTNDGQVEIGDD